jgi:MFS family permease
MSTASTDRAARRTSFREVLGVREFRALWLAQAQSLAGDQLARVALSVLVFGHTHSTALTALVYALTFVPAILGGVLFGGLADRFPRREVMVACDAASAVGVLVMSIPAVPLGATCAVLVVVVLVGQPLAAAQAALLPEVVGGERYVLGMGLRMLTGQSAQLAGFAVGGVTVAAIGAHGALSLDALTFAISAVIVRLFVHERPRPPVAAPRRRWTPGLVRATGRFVWQDRRLRTLVGLGWLAALHVVPEALAAPYAADLGGGAIAVGLLMAAPPAGTAIGVLVFLRFTPQRRARLMGPLAVASAVPMIACATRPGLAVSIVLWALLGAFAAYQVQAAAAFVQLVPDTRRGRVLGLVGSGMSAVQGLGVLGFGFLGQHMGAADAVALAGAAAAVLGVGLAVASTRAWRASG